MDSTKVVTSHSTVQSSGKASSWSLAWPSRTRSLRNSSWLLSPTAYSCKQAEKAPNPSGKKPTIPLLQHVPSITTRQGTQAATNAAAHHPDRKHLPSLSVKARAPSGAVNCAWCRQAGPKRYAAQGEGRVAPGEGAVSRGRTRTCSLHLRDTVMRTSDKPTNAL